MATTATAVPMEKVKDPELVGWLAEDSGELREILVDAVLPRRQVVFHRNGGRWSPSDLQTGAEPGRRETLSKLRTVLLRFVDTPPVILESAGALAIRANSQQVRQFMDHPLIRSVRSNRKLRGRAYG